MVSTVILTLISLIVMLAVDGLDPFETVSSNPHPAFGLASIICAFIQPIMAAFRPHPGSRYSQRVKNDCPHGLNASRRGKGYAFCVVNYKGLMWEELYRFEVYRY